MQEQASPMSLHESQMQRRFCLDSRAVSRSSFASFSLFKALHRRHGTGCKAGWIAKFRLSRYDLDLRATAASESSHVTLLYSRTNVLACFAPLRSRSAETILSRQGSIVAIPPVTKPPPRSRTISNRYEPLVPYRLSDIM